MLDSKLPYLKELLDRLAPAKWEQGTRDLIDEVVHVYIREHTQAEGSDWDDSSPEASETNALAVNLGDLLKDAFGKDFLNAIHQTKEYKDALTEAKGDDEDEEDENE